MPKIDAVFFWLGGVITEAIPDAVARLVYEKPLAKVPIDDRLRLRELVGQLYVGQISAQAFCQDVIEQSKKRLNAALLESRIATTVQPRVDVLEVVDALENYECWLLSDYPGEWTQAIVKRLDLSQHFSERHILITANGGLKQLVPDVFNLMAEKAGKPLQSCLMIDADSARAVQAVRYGLQSTIHVDARRTRRDFVMRRMLPQPPGFVMPGPRRLP